MAYALGKYSKAQCDRCGFVYPYLELREEWQGLKVCRDCYEPKAPQIDPINVPVDPEALKDPRTTESAPTAGNGVVKTENSVANGVSSPSTLVSHNDVIGSSFRSSKMTSELGSVTVTTGS